MSTNHSPAPWSAGYMSNLINDRDGKAVCQFWRRDDKEYLNKNWNVKRIIECVNALEGTQNPAQYLQQITLERAAYLSELKQSRETIKMLREALERAKSYMLNQSATNETVDVHSTVAQALDQSRNQ